MRLKMNMNIERYTIVDAPIPYKGLMIYPIRMRDYVLFNTYVQSLLFDKNEIPDVKIISMTKLEYMYHAIADENAPPLLLWFDRLLSLCLKDDDTFEDITISVNTRYIRDEKGKPFFLIGGERYDSADFENIRELICEQNLIELPDTSISKEVRDSLEKAREYRRKLSGSKPASLEDHVISLASATGWTLEYVYDMTVRKFKKSIQRLDNLIHYKIYLSASMSGMVEFKDKSFIKHWLSDIDENDKYGDVSVDLDAMRGKVSLPT